MGNQESNVGTSGMLHRWKHLKFVIDGVDYISINRLFDHRTLDKHAGIRRDLFESIEKLSANYYSFKFENAPEELLIYFDLPWQKLILIPLNFELQKAIIRDTLSNKLIMCAEKQFTHSLVLINGNTKHTPLVESDTCKILKLPKNFKHPKRAVISRYLQLQVKQLTNNKIEVWNQYVNVMPNFAWLYFNSHIYPYYAGNCLSCTVFLCPNRGIVVQTELPDNFKQGQYVAYLMLDSETTVEGPFTYVVTDN